MNTIYNHCCKDLGVTINIERFKKAYNTSLEKIRHDTNDATVTEQHPAFLSLILSELFTNNQARQAYYNIYKRKI